MILLTLGLGLVASVVCMCGSAYGMFRSITRGEPLWLLVFAFVTCFLLDSIVNLAQLCAHYML